MVLALAGGLVTQVVGGAATAPMAPVFDWMNQEIYKLMPVRKTDVSGLLTLVYRKEIDKITYYERMARHGFSKDESDRMFLAAEFFPSVQDAIRFAVREADRDDIAELFETDEDFDKLPKEEFLKSRITDKQLKRYWRAHWDLPGVGQAFEMFHRLAPEQLEFKEQELADLKFSKEQVVTTLDTLNILLKTQDVMPFWRRRLPMIAYKPIGRIDVRRLEDFDIVDDEKLEFMNRESGFSPVSAKDLSLWTRLNNALKDLKPMVKTGQINFEDAVTALIEEGATPAVARKLIFRRVKTTKKLRAQKIVNKLIDEILKSVANENIESDDAKRALEGLNLTAEEADSEIKLAIVAQQGDIKGKKELEDLVNSVAMVTGRPPGILKEGRKDVIGWNYTLELEDEKRTQVDIFLAEKHESSDRVLDVEKTGLYGEVLRRVPVFKVSEKV